MDRAQVAGFESTPDAATFPRGFTASAMRTISKNEAWGPVTMFRHMWRFRSIIGMLTVRQLQARYKGTILGFAWAMAEPLMMLAVYTFVFSVIFKGNWGQETSNGLSATALILFMGLITYGIFAEVVAQAPTLMLQHQNFVKKIVFPLEILPVVSIICALSTALFSLLVLILGVVFIFHRLPVTLLMIPLAWIPMLFLSLGCSYFLASLGVFVKDTKSAVNVLVTVLRFVTPIFYPLSVVPERLRPAIEYNPISIFIETARRVGLWETMPQWALLFWGAGISFVAMYLGFVWFMKVKHAFADVI